MINLKERKQVKAEGVLETLLAKQVADDVWHVWMINGGVLETYTTQELELKLKELKNKGWKV